MRTSPNFSGLKFWSSVLCDEPKELCSITQKFVSLNIPSSSRSTMGFPNKYCDHRAPHAPQGPPHRSSADDELIRALLVSNTELRSFISTMETAVSGRIVEMEHRVSMKLAQMESRIYQLLPLLQSLHQNDDDESFSSSTRKRKHSMCDNENFSTDAPILRPEGFMADADINEAEVQSEKMPPQRNEIWEILASLHPKLSRGGCELTSASVLDRMEYSQPSEVIWCLKFIDKFWTVEEKTAMQDPSLSEEDLTYLAKSIQERMVKKVQELEEKVGRQTGRYQGFGKKVRQLEKEGKWI
jgi:hypothetical protein